MATVYTFNPAANTAQQSFLRISNTGSNSGKVTITGKDDTAAAGGSVSFTLGAGKSMQLTAQDLENGNTAKGLTGSLGDGTGKWTLTVTGEIAGMEGQDHAHLNTCTGRHPRLGAWAVERIEAKSRLRDRRKSLWGEDRFSTIRRLIVVLWAKKRRKYGPRRRLCSPVGFYGPGS